MQWLLYPFVFIAGVLNTIQGGSNATLNKVLGQPVVAGLVVYIVGGIGLLLAAPFLGLSLRDFAAKAGEVPWWGWIGGLLGAVYVVAMLVAAKPLGAGAFTALTLTAAVLTSIVMDHFGLVGFDVHPVNLMRAIGGVLLIAGVLLVAIF